MNKTKMAVTETTDNYFYNRLLMDGFTPKQARKLAPKKAKEVIKNINKKGTWKN